jgi:hypothetical protein
VTLPVSIPSTDTWAPDGNEVTFSQPFFSALTLFGRNRSAPPSKLIHTSFTEWVIQSSSDPSTSTLAPAPAPVLVSMPYAGQTGC